jgi:mannose-6-phosphate isomerase
MNKSRIHDGKVHVSKPWGQYTDIYRTKNVVFKRIEVSPGEEMSYQYHSKRDEFWYILEGHGLMIINDIEASAFSGDTFSIKSGVKHQVKNIGTSTLVIFEMQVGVCDENDIVRLTDKYNRNQKEES